MPTARTIEIVLDLQKNFEMYPVKEDIELEFISDYGVKADKANIELLKQTNLTWRYWTVRKQRQWLKERFPRKALTYWDIFPQRADALRSLGFLIAFEDNPSLIISLDDDNYPHGDFIGGHKIVGRCDKMYDVYEVFSHGDWLNPCIAIDSDVDIYSRGFPYSKRGMNTCIYNFGSGNVVLNFGLWYGALDVDALTRLTLKLRTYKRYEDVKHVCPKLVRKGTYVPIPTQNTAFDPKIVPAYYQLIMNVPMHGLRLHRYGDIWAGLFLQKIMHQIGDQLTYGLPLTNHKRKAKPPVDELRDDFWGIVLNEYLVDVVEKIQLNSKDYVACYQELINGLRNAEPYPDSEIQKYFKKLYDCMELWLEVYDRLC